MAIAAGVIGGGTATLVGQLNGQDSAATGSSGVVNGTTVSQSSKGTVAGVAEAVSPAIVEIRATVPDPARAPGRARLGRPPQSGSTREEDHER
ncbi:hypothetical protein SCALM49S_06174 [Streptomyces californicus]